MRERSRDGIFSTGSNTKRVFSTGSTTKRGRGGVFWQGRVAILLFFSFALVGAEPQGAGILHFSYYLHLFLSALSLSHTTRFDWQSGSFNG